MVCSGKSQYRKKSSELHPSLPESFLGPTDTVFCLSISDLISIDRHFSFAYLKEKKSYICYSLPKVHAYRLACEVSDENMLLFIHIMLVHESSEGTQWPWELVALKTSGDACRKHSLFSDTCTPPIISEKAK